jgi:N-methylhydantoinase B
MAAERGPVETFDFGGTMEELRARCKEDTTFDPPSPPVFQKWMGRSKPPELAQAAE